MPKKKTKAVMVDGIPIKPISPAEHRRLERRIKKKYEKLRRRYPEVHGKKVDWISHWHEEGYLSFNVRFTDGKNFSILCSPTIVTNVVDFSDVKTGDSVIIREYYKRRDDDGGENGDESEIDQQVIFDHLSLSNWFGWEVLAHQFTRSPRRRER